MMSSLPASAGPARLIASESRIACGRPPTTVRLSWDSALKVAGPHGPVGRLVEQGTGRVEKLGTLALGEQPEHGQLGPDLGHGRPGVAAGVGVPRRAR